MKIIQICAAYKPAYVYGGPTMSVSKLSEELVKAGEDVMVLTTTANGKDELDVPTGKETLVDGVKVYYFKRLTKDHTHFSPSLLSFLHQTIKNAKRQTPNATRNTLNPQLIVHIHAWWNLVSIFSALVAKWYGVKVILSPRGMLTSYSLNNRNSKVKDTIHFFLGKRLLKYAHIHATSEKERKDVLQTCEVNGVTVIPNFVRFPSSVRPEIGEWSTGVSSSQPDTYKLLFLSRIEEKKGLELLFSALSQVNIPYQLSIAGTGEESYIKSLQTLATDLGIASNIRWLGHIEKQSKFDMISASDLMVLTSYNENFANVVIESLAMGTPVLISEEVGLADYVAANKIGWVTSLDVEAIVRNIELSYKDLTKRTYIRETAPALIQHDFEESRLAATYVKLYQNSFK
ncbi:MAG: glycosyltransferase [Pedobacter sp.]|uniref:XrtY-associated glycosyltransferase XYAG1 n=1 Tax=Pedobacter sp. TaxID=1411316 RepID=UPI002808E033|nr:glycosyltransferase [Pedobacter sp.]MDQ8004890.1 glycosyltransferase [Pedobacter sp.]